MFTLRCTKKLLNRLRVAPAASPSAPSTRLGDWYANIQYTPVGQLVLAVSERTLLPVILPAKEARTLATRLPPAIAEVLRALGVPDALVDAELDEMRQSAIAPTASR